MGGHSSAKAPSDHASSSSESETDSDEDSDEDSGYCSLEDEDEEAKYYDDLLATFREQGPTLASHGENTRRMKEKQEEKWNKYGSPGPVWR